MSGLVAVLLGLTGVVYAVWPWLRGRARPSLDDAREVRAGEELDSIVKALREWSVAAGEVGIEALEAIERAPRAEVRGE